MSQRPSLFRSITDAFRIGLRHGSDQADRALAPVLGAIAGKAAGRSDVDTAEHTAATTSHARPPIEVKARRIERAK